VLATNADYQVTALYDGSDMEIYLNGELDNFVPMAGSILQTNVDLTIGEALPTEQNYNYSGVLDDIRLYNYGLPFSAVQQLYQETAGVHTGTGSEIPNAYLLNQNYPNPFNPTTAISYQLPAVSDVKLVVYDMLGREVAVLVKERKAPGTYEVKFDGSNLASGVYYLRLQSGDFSQVRPMVLLK
jgi:hypothetical protein